MDLLCNQHMLSELMQGLWISIKLKVRHISLKETTIWWTTLVRSALSFTTTKRWENTSTLFDDTLSTKVDNSDTFPTKLVTATLYRKIEKAVHHGWKSELIRKVFFIRPSVWVTSELYVDEHNQSDIRLTRHDIRTIVYTENMSLHVLRSLCMYVDRNDPTNTGWTKKDSNIN